ncbi:MAG: type phosphodiesterase/nucleotide pyrophosphatase, partial [Gemmatimonadetes bacterium]|nr:type phosphodiesterase/nucleotide pyrophosphatase [Gemmatimonadota bacterium]
ARTRGIEGFFVGSTWASLYTGTNPAQHGLHYQMQLVPGSYRLEDRAKGAFVQRDPFWRVLSRAGRRVAVLDVPLSRIEPELNGVQVVEWGAHDAFFGHSTIPPELASQIEARVGRHPAGASCDAAGRGAREYRELVSALAEGVRRKGEWSTELLARGDWDLFMQVFTESHCVGHQCWHLHDAAHPAHDAIIAGMTGDPLRVVYRAIDAAIGTLVDTARDAHVIVFAAHGMSHRYGAHFLLRDLLFALGAATPPAKQLRERVRDVASRAWHALPAAARTLLSPLRRRVMPDTSASAHSGSSGIGVDVDRSRCFPLANGLAVSGIRLNLVGREPRGVLAPGKEADRFVETLTEDLLAIVDDASGAPLVGRVLRTRDHYCGEHLDALPDLLLEWNESVAIGSTALADGAGARVRARSPRIGTIEGANDYGRSGEHRPGGWLVAAGPGVERGRLERAPSLLDLAPTFARILGVELPGAEGTPIAEIVD